MALFLLAVPLSSSIMRLNRLNRLNGFKISIRGKSEERPKRKLGLGHKRSIVEAGLKFRLSE